MKQPIRILPCKLLFKSLLIISWMFFSPHRLFAETSTPQGQLIDQVIASVDDEPIFKSELEIEYAHYQQQLGLDKGPTKCQILENMIINKLMLVHAAKKGIYIKEEEIKRYFDYRMKGIVKEIGSEAQLEQYLKQVMHKSLQVFKAELRKSIKDQLTIEKLRNTIIDDITISPSEVKTFFDQLPTEDMPFYPASVEAYHLVVYPPINQTQRNATIEKLEAIKARIQAGEDFASLAKEYSEDPGTSIRGGELGFWRIGELDPVYEKAALALKPGELSAPVETKFGSHLIQLIERQKDSYNTRHILLKPSVAEPNMQEAIQKLNELRALILDKQLSFEQASTNYSEDMDTARKGGLLTDYSEGVCIPVDNLAPDLFFIIDKMAPGSISEPMIFNTSTGKEAARVVYLKNKILAHQANLDQDYEKIHQLALAAKKQQALNAWVEQMKSKAIIELGAEYEACGIRN